MRMTIYVDMFLYLEMKIHENPATYCDVKSKVCWIWSIFDRQIFTVTPSHHPGPSQANALDGALYKPFQWWVPWLRLSPEWLGVVIWCCCVSVGPLPWWCPTLCLCFAEDTNPTGRVLNRFSADVEARIALIGLLSSNSTQDCRTVLVVNRRKP